MSMCYFRRASALIALTAASGCAQMKAADDWAMNKVLEERGQVGQLQPEPWPGVTKVPPEANCRFTTVYREGDNCCVMQPYTVAMDVDAAYAKARVEYAFHERRPRDEGVNYPGYHGHVHEATPGAFYRVFGEVQPRSDVRLSRGVWMALVLSKASSSTANVEPVYCEIRGRRMKEQGVWHQAVQDSIRSTLPPIARK